ncbi:MULTISPECIES: ABC transporter ATP-binding protein [unclassified Schlesneria]|uniref:ABC transporter ATP-binding protein n=1 Tax=unclassified Schlesneria TaxID=2762017 RepID=UPI002F01C787
MLEARELTKAYRSHVALSQLNLCILPGEVFCLLGANGAGKSTTIKLFLNFISPTSGEVKINGLNPRAHPAQTRSWLGYIPEQVSLYPRLSGIENLRYFASLAGESNLHRQRLSDALKQAGLPESAIDRRAADYSKGMRQKVVIALALVRRVKGLLLDEPTSGLDPQAAHEFSRVLRQLSDEGVAILMASHDLYQVRQIASRIGIMRQGVLVETFQSMDVSHLELEQRALQLMK